MKITCEICGTEINQDKDPASVIALSCAVENPECSLININTIPFGKVGLKFEGYIMFCRKCEKRIQDWLSAFIESGFGQNNQ